MKGGKAFTDAEEPLSVTAKWIPIDDVADAKYVPSLTILQLGRDIVFVLALGPVPSRFFTKPRQFGTADHRS